MNRIIVLILAMAYIGFFLPSCVQAQQGLYGKPARMRDLTDLRLAEGADLTSVQKTEILLSWLAAERNSPSATTQGLGGGPIDSDYIQAQIVKVMETQADPTAISWVASSPLLKDEVVRDCMKLVAGFMGDKTQIPELERILLKNPNPFLRAIAGEDLGLLGSVSSIPILETARKDSFSQTFASEANGGKVTTYYPVRQVAEEELRILTTPISFARHTKLGEIYALRAAEAKKHPPAAPFTAEHFASLANGDQN